MNTDMTITLISLSLLFATSMYVEMNKDNNDGEMQ